MPKGTPNPDADLRRHHPNINEAWFADRLRSAAGPLHESHWNRWACEQISKQMGRRLAPSVLTRLLKGRKKWPLDFTVGIAKVLKTDVDVVIALVGPRPAPRRGR